jgi:hypothetical protein
MHKVTLIAAVMTEGIVKCESSGGREGMKYSNRKDKTTQYVKNPTKSG